MPYLILINPNTNSASTRLMVEVARAVAPVGFEIEGATVQHGASLIDDQRTLDQAATGVVALAETLAPADGFIVAAFADPGLQALRTVIKAPVVGIAQASMAEAARGRRPFGVATVTPGLEAAIRRCASDYGYGDCLCSLRFTAGDPKAFMTDPVLTVEALAQAVEQCLDDGAEAVVIGGGPLARAAQALAPEYSVPIIEPVPAAVRALVRAL